MGINLCSECLKKQREIDQLSEEIKRLKAKLRYQERKEREGFFGSSTPSSKMPLKPNTPQEKEKKKPGARPGHKGFGRKRFDACGADRVLDVEAGIGDVCPDCGGPLADKGTEERMVIESRPVKAQRLLYRLRKKHCPCCRRSFRARAPAVLPKSLFGNQLIATAATMHYLHGIPMGRICEQIGIDPGSLVEIFHHLGRLFSQVPQRLIEQYRQSPVKHADETGWRTNGKNGYAWLFATEKISVFQFRNTRSARVPRAVFGTNALPGVLVVDRYAGYSKTPCAIQYCYSHLLREIQDLEKEFPDVSEVKAFVSTVAPLLSLAMNLRGQPISDAAFSHRAAELKAQILDAMNQPAQHAGIQHIQDIFRINQKRLYHWAEDRKIPAENNLAERNLRPTVIARKVSFGSQSDAGAHTRGLLMSALHTLKKQGFDVNSQLKCILDELANDIHQDPFPLLFPRASPRH
jgi:transposase